LIAGAMNFVMYFNSSKAVMRAYKARTLSRDEATGLYAIVDRLRQRAGLPMPTVAIAPDAQPNALMAGAWGFNTIFSRPPRRQNFEVRKH
jgi:heat shock protein HtpX